MKFEAVVFEVMRGDDLNRTYVGLALSAGVLSAEKIDWLVQ